MHNQNDRLAFVVVFGCWLLYAVLTFMAPSPNIYHLSSLQLLLIQLTIIIPVLVIWMTATYGAVHFKRYSRAISDSPDGQALGNVTTGLLVLIGSFIVQTLLGILPRFAVGSPIVMPLVFLHNHMPLVIASIAVWYMYEGSGRLAHIVNARISRRQVTSILIPFVAVSAVVSFYYFTHVIHYVANGIPNFALPGKLPFVTLLAPYLAVWLFGLLTITNIANYTRNVKGAIYKESLGYLAYGIMSVITFTIALQFLTLASRALSQLGIGPILMLIYLILILYGLGYVLIAVGARKLARIEAVQ